MALSVCELAVELQLSAVTDPMTLLRRALTRVSVILQESEEGRIKEFLRTFVSYTGCWMAIVAVI